MINSKSILSIIVIAFMLSFSLIMINNVRTKIVQTENNISRCGKPENRGNAGTRRVV